MRRVLLLSPALIALACAPELTVATSGESETSTSTTTDGTETETETSTTTETETETETGETGEPPPEPLPPLVGDNCEVEVLWTLLDDGAFGHDELHVLEVSEPGSFVVGGFDEDNDVYTPMVLGVVDGEVAWTDSWGPPSGSQYQEPVVDIEIFDDGTIAVLVDSSSGRVRTYTSAGELIDQSILLNSTWEDMVREGDELRVLGLVWKGVDVVETTLARYDQLGMLLDTVAAPTVGITTPDPDWATALFTEGDRVWVSGWDDDRCGVLIEFNAAGEEQWWDCAMNGEDGEGRLEAMTSLSDGNLAMVGSVRVTKAGFWYHEPAISVWTRDGMPVWEWTNGPLTALRGLFYDVAALPDGLVVVQGEANLSQGGLDAREFPVIHRKDNAGEFVARCKLDRPGVDPLWEAELTAVAIGPNQEIYALMAERMDGLWDRNHAIVQITGL